MSRRTSLPGAAELFRTTGASPAPATPELPLETASAADVQPPVSLPDSAPVQDRPEPVRRRSRGTADRRPTGRERHDEKITVYVSADELMDLERARLTLRGDHGLVADRGRLVREALAVVLADLDAKGEASILVRRLGGR